jgi:ABC-type branched-subunit amino acid transport system substrate-binding protein
MVMTAIFAATKSNAQPRHYSAAQHSVLVAKWGSMAAILLLTAACQTVVPRGGRVPSAQKPEPIVIPADGKHHVALLVPLTGPDADVGRALANATAVALIDTGNTTITVQTYDTALGAAGAAQRALADGSKLILGPLRGDNVVAVAEIAQTRNVPIISFSNDIGVAGRNAFLLGHLPDQSISRTVRFAKSRGLNRFGAIVPKTVYGQRASSDFTRAVKNAGGTLVSIQEIDGSTASIDAATRRLESAGQVDAVMVADTGRSAMAIVPSIRSHGMKNAKILGTELWNIDSTLAGNAAMRGAWFSSVSDGYFRTFAAKYRTRYGNTPLRLASLGYDSILLTMRVAPKWKLGTTFPINQLTDKDGFIGIDGAFRFTADGMSERMLEVQEIQKGKFVTIDAAPQTFKP